MFKYLLFILLFLIVASVAAIRFTPLRYVLSQVSSPGLTYGWANVEGTLMQGRISGLYVGNHAVGDVDLKLRPGALLSGKVSYDVRWGGAGGRGSAVIDANQTIIEARDIRLNQSVAAMESLASTVRAIGGHVRIPQGQAKFNIKTLTCETTNIDIWSDALSTAASQYGRTFQPLTGALTCADGAFRLDLSSTSEQKDTVQVNAIGQAIGPSSFDVTVSSTDDELRAALLQLGFVLRDGEMKYVRTFEGP